MDLKKMIVDTLDKLESEGKIQQIIEKHLTDAVNSAVAQIFSYNSTLTENLKKTFKEHSQVDITELSIPEYNKLMLAKIQSLLDSNIHQVGLEKFEKDIKEVLGKSLPAEMKVSEIIQKYIEELDEDERKGDIAFFSELDSAKYFHFYFDNEEQDNKFSCKYQVHCGSDGTIYHFRSDSLKHDQVRIGSIYGIDKLFFKLYAAGTRIIPDFENVDTSTYTEGD